MHNYHLLISRLGRWALLAILTVVEITPARAATLALTGQYKLESLLRHAVSFDVVGSDRVVVADYDAPAIILFDARGARQRSFSRPGRAHCEIAGPRAVAASAQGIAVWDQQRHHLLQFDWDGTCSEDDVIVDWEIAAGAMTIRDHKLLVAGSVGESPCVFFSVDLRQPRLASCLYSVANEPILLLYAREFVTSGPRFNYFALPYESIIRRSNSGAMPPARALFVRGINLPKPILPANERQIRSTRKLFFEFYNAQQLIEGIAAVSDGFVVVTRTPSGPKYQVDLYYYVDGSTTPAAASTFATEAVVGAYPVNVRGDGGKHVYLLVAHGSWPSLRYEVMTYEIR